MNHFCKAGKAIICIPVDVSNHNYVRSLLRKLNQKPEKNLCYDCRE